MTAFLLHQLLSESARCMPERLAVMSQTGSLNYRELDEASDRLAAALQLAGLVPGDRVGIALEKSLECIIAMFGILKAGAAYVPLDSRAPAKRAAFILSDCGVRGLITSRERLARLAAVLESMPPCVVSVDGAGPGDAILWKEIMAAAAQPSDPGVIEQDLAYILYTSGSTGEPKGVMLSHRAGLSFVNWAVEYFGLGPKDRLSNHAPLHFDLSIFDVFGAVAAGASVALVPPAVGVFPRNLADWIAASEITVWYSVPSALIQLALNGGLDRHGFARLRLVLFAGEVFPVRHLRTLMEQVPHPAYFNLYGPTETNVCTVYAVPAMPPADGGPLPIGRACANSQVFVLDEEARPVKTQETGELYVRGPTLMHGYWGRAEQTRKVLVPHPVRADAGERVYRTGDLVRQDAGGNLQFIGRRDLQVKSRGYRIELGDVEAVLYRHPKVAEAAVVARPHEEFGCTLHGVIAPRPGNSLTRAELAGFCAEHLPAYMVPGSFELHDALPKTSSGKVDRAALAGRA